MEMRWIFMKKILSKEDIQHRCRQIPELLYPRHCPFCDGLLKDDEPYLCRSCAKKIKFISGPVCMKCGRPLDSDTAEYCDSCRRKEHRYIQGFAPFIYRGMAQASIMKFKYGERAEYARFYAEAILRYGRRKIRDWDIGAVIPVPVHPLRYCARGYNQAQVLAEELAGKLGVPELGYLVRRVRNTKPQKGLTPSGRRKNLHGAFRVDEGVTFPENVLLVDDIYTTGTTIDELASVVADHGAKNIWFVCVTIAPGMT